MCDVYCAAYWDEGLNEATPSTRSSEQDVVGSYGSMMLMFPTLRERPTSSFTANTVGRDVGPDFTKVVGTSLPGIYLCELLHRREF